MQAHGISDLDVEHVDIQEEGTRAGAALNPARWECALATRVASAFDCSVFLARAHPVGRWVFVGAAPSGEIARYAFEVLFRQAKSARAHYIKTALKRCTTTRTRRADLFCEGWVLTATELVERFSGSEAAQARVTAYLEHKHKLTSFEGKNRNAGRNLSERDYGDMEAGHRAGRTPSSIAVWAVLTSAWRWELLNETRRPHHRRQAGRSPAPHPPHPCGQARAGPGR